MVFSKTEVEGEVPYTSELTASQRRRLRRKKLYEAKYKPSELLQIKHTALKTKPVPNSDKIQVSEPITVDVGVVTTLNTVNKLNSKEVTLDNNNMSSKDAQKPREDVKAAREAKKLAKQKAKNKGDVAESVTPTEKKQKETPPKDSIEKVTSKSSDTKSDPTKCVDEVDRAAVREEPVVAGGEKTKEQILAERAAKKASKHAKKKGGEDTEVKTTVTSSTSDSNKQDVSKTSEVTAKQEMTVQDVVETLKDIKNVAKEVQDLTAKVSAIHFEANKPEELGKSKAELKAERRAKQEAQRAAKQGATVQKAAKAKPEATKAKPEAAKAKPELVVREGSLAKEKSPKPKLKVKSLSTNRVNWFQHLNTEHDKESLKKIALNSNLHPAVVKLGVQLAARVVSGSNARCIALLDAIKKMLKDYTLPAKTEFSRGFEPHLSASLDFLWAMRPPTASQTNAVKYFRHHLNQLPNNVDEFDAKKTLQEEIDKYIEDQIDKAGEAISMTVRNKISNGDNILTYGCSSLIERILREAWQARVQFRAVVVGNRVHGGGRELLRRLSATGVPCSYADITALSAVMATINKVVVGASSLLADGSVLGALGTAQVALAARAHNVPVLVAAETHKFSERVQTDAFVYNEIGDPDELIDNTDDNSPLKDWRSNPNLTLLNLTYDVTPPSLVTAVVTEKAILPCTSAPVVLRTKLLEYGM